MLALFVARNHLGFFEVDENERRSLDVNMVPGSGGHFRNQEGLEDRMHVGVSDGRRS